MACGHPERTICVFLVDSFVIMLALITWSTYPVTATIDSGKAIVYVGTFKRESSKGIYAWRLDIELPARWIHWGWRWTP